MLGIDLASWDRRICHGKKVSQIGPYFDAAEAMVWERMMAAPFQILLSLFGTKDRSFCYSVISFPMLTGLFITCHCTSESLESSETSLQLGQDVSMHACSFELKIKLMSTL